MGGMVSTDFHPPIPLWHQHTNFTFLYCRLTPCLLFHCKISIFAKVRSKLQSVYYTLDIICITCHHFSISEGTMFMPQPLARQVLDVLYKTLERMSPLPLHLFCCQSLWFLVSRIGIVSLTVLKCIKAHALYCNKVSLLM